MGQQYASRFCCGAWMPDAMPLDLRAEEAFCHKDQRWILSSERPVTVTPTLSLCVMGTVWEPGAPYRPPEETVADLYARLGANFPTKLDGWFLAILFDHVRQMLLVANNTYTSSGCYYHYASGRLLLADSMKKMLRLLSYTPRLRPSTLVNYLNSGFNHSEHTCFEGIYKLLPGHMLTFSERGLSLNRYDTMEFHRRRQIDVEIELDEYDRIFHENIKSFLAAGKVQEAGGAISGGLDTSWTLYHLARAHPRHVHGFTVYFRQRQYSELDEASSIARHLGVIHHPILFGPKDLDLFPVLISMTGEPVLSVALPVFKMMREAALVVDALVMGEGGNNVFNIYYPVAEAHRYLRRLPFLVRKALHETCKALGHATDNEFLNLAAHVMKIYASDSDYRLSYFERLTSHFHFDKEARAELLDPAFFGDGRMDRPAEDLPLRDDTFFDDMIRQNITWGLKHYLLFFEHRAATEMGLLLHAPFVSPAVVSFVNTLPMEWVMGGSSLSRLLKRTSSDRPFHRLALKRVYGDMHRNKNAKLFYAPYLSLFHERPSAADALLRALRRRGWFNDKVLVRLFEEHRWQREHRRLNFRMSNHGQRLMALLGCEVFARLFLDGREVDMLSPPCIEDFLDA